MDVKTKMIGLQVWKNENMYPTRILSPPQQAMHPRLVYREEDYHLFTEDQKLKCQKLAKIVNISSSLRRTVKRSIIPPTYRISYD
jgi:hypothetical protein